MLWSMLGTYAMFLCLSFLALLSSSPPSLSWKATPGPHPMHDRLLTARNNLETEFYALAYCGNVNSTLQRDFQLLKHYFSSVAVHSWSLTNSGGPTILHRFQGCNNLRKLFLGSLSFLHQQYCVSTLFWGNWDKKKASSVSDRNY